MYLIKSEEAINLKPRVIEAFWFLFYAYIKCDVLKDKSIFVIVLFMKFSAGTNNFNYF